MLRALAAALVLAIVFGSVSWAFFSALHSGFAHADAQNAALGYGYASALCWGLSVVGYLIWSSLLPVWFGITTTSNFWISWFNLFAAISAAASVAYSTL